MSTRRELRNFIDSLCVDAISIFETTDGHRITGRVIDTFNDEGDIDYKYHFTIDGEDADEYDVLNLAE